MASESVEIAGCGARMLLLIAVRVGLMEAVKAGLSSPASVWLADAREVKRTSCKFLVDLYV